MEIMLLFGVGFIGLVFALIGTIMITMRRIFEPRKEMKFKINQLEKEIEDLKAKI